MAIRFAEAGNVEFTEYRPSLWAVLLTTAALLGMSLGLGLSLFWPRGAIGDAEYQLWKWEANTLLDNVFARIGIGPDLDAGDADDALAQYFTLTSQLRAAASVANPDVTLVETLTNERATYENDVELVIETYIDEAVRLAGLERRLPLFIGAKLVWPPVDFELTNPPQLLVRSPRAEIRRDGDTLLKNDLTLREIERIEDNTTDDDTVTVIISIGGLAAYPAIVRDDRAYDSVLETASHEWVHHYLAFYPLGEQWGNGGDAETLNETTASIAGREIANLITRNHPVEFPAGEDGRLPPRPTPSVDSTKELRALRLEVDGLLKEGRVGEAESRMEETRLFLNASGVSIRKINQAYFAFYGTYADSPQSSNPVGPKIERVWELTRDVGLFLRVMRDVTSLEDLDEALVGLE